MTESSSQTQPNHTGSTRPSKPDDQGKTFPARPGKSKPSPTRSTTPSRDQSPQPLGRRKRMLRLVVWSGLAVISFGLAAFIGGLNGYHAAVQTRQSRQDFAQVKSLVEQYQWGVLDQQAGRYAIAKQRYEWVLAQDPNFPDASQRLAEVNDILFATATPTPTPPPTPTITPSPTPDLRPIQDLFATAQSHLQAEDWSGVIDTIINLRSVDASYKVVQVDRMLYIALRNRGVEKILRGGDLEGGTYDLTLAEQFGPLDAEANYAQGWARLYEYGSAFWGADPQAAVYYFSQVAAAAPYLRDGAGWTAIERYRAVLIQYGDQLANQDEWCSAEDQYRAAANIRNDANLQTTVDNAQLKCSPPTATPSLTPTFTLTPSPTSTGTLEPTWTSSPIPPTLPSETLTPTVTETVTESTPTTEIPTTEAPTLTPSPTVTPSPSQPPTEEPPSPTETSTPTPTDTQASPADTQLPPSLTEVVTPLPSQQVP